MLWFLIAGFSALVLAHMAPFPFLLERFAPVPLDLAHAGSERARHRLPDLRRWPESGRDAGAARCPRGDRREAPPSF